MSGAPARFQRPTAAARAFNRAWGFLVGLGIGFAHSYQLEVRGRRSGRVRATPVNLLVLDGRRYLVAPRGAAAWVLNARAAGEIVLRRGRTRDAYRLRELADAEKPPVLKAYLDRFKTSVQPYFTVPAGSPRDAFTVVAADHPAFELTPAAAGSA
jgi:deazaflavin-dependent oxidoreductase (nitroreductase family)